MIHDRHPAGQDHEEVVAAVSLPEQHLARRDRPDLTLPAQQADLLAGQPQFDHVSGRPVTRAVGRTRAGSAGQIAVACHRDPTPHRARRGGSRRAHAHSARPPGAALLHPRPHALRWFCA